MLPAGFVERVSKTVNYKKPWMVDYTFCLATEEMLPGIVDECIKAGIYGLDTETTGLDTRVYPIIETGYLKTQVDLVGVCVYPGNKVGYYIPLGHMPDGEPYSGNVSFLAYEKEFRRLFDSNAIAVFHNAKYDQEILTFTGRKPICCWDEPTKWEDTMILMFLEDSTRKWRGLKKASRDFLGKEMIKITELFGSEYGDDDDEDEEIDFKNLNPSRLGVVEYAASDAICTLELYHYIKDKALSLPSKDNNGAAHTQNLVYYIEKLCQSAVRWMERCRIHVDLNKVEELIKVGNRDMIQSLKDVYDGSSAILGRDITPVSFFLFLEKTNGGDVSNLVPTIENPAPLRKLIDECNNEAERYISLYEKNDFGIRKLCQENEKLDYYLSRQEPGEKSGFVLKKEYNVLSNKDLGIMLFDMGVKVVISEKNNILSNEDVIDDILKKSGDKFPFLSKIGKVRSNDSALSRLANLFRDTDRRDSTIKSSYNQLGTETGRFSVSEGKKKDPKKTGITRYNIQATTAMNDSTMAPAMYYARLIFTARKRKNGKKGFIIAIDFSGVELRIITNFSREPKWVDAFFRCSSCQLVFAKDTVPPKYCPVCGSDRIGDVHTLTTIELFGAESKNSPKWKFLRASGKATNFSMCYGGGPAAVERATGVGMNEAQRLVRKFRMGYKVLQKWWDNKHAFAREFKYVLTAFGRKFPLPSIKHEDSFIRSKEERNALNSPVQGSSADITKIAMGLVYQECKKRGWVYDPPNVVENKVYMTITMHDELVFDVDDDILEEFCDMSIPLMTSNKAIMSRNWIVPLTVDCEIGNDWSVPWNLSQIREAVDIRKKLQNPESDREIKQTLRRVDGFWGRNSVEKKFKSFEEIGFPKDISPFFKEGSPVFSEEERKSLLKSWNMYFGFKNGEEEEGEGVVDSGAIETTEVVSDGIVEINEYEPVKQGTEIKAVEVETRVVETKKVIPTSVSVSDDTITYSFKQLTEKSMSSVLKVIQESVINSDTRLRMVDNNGTDMGVDLMVNKKLFVEKVADMESRG